jgi:hypothetical protein
MNIEIPKPPKPSTLSLHPDHARIVRERFARQLEKDAAVFMAKRRPGRALADQARAERIRRAP